MPADDTESAGSGGKYALVGILALAIIVADQWTKLWIDADMRLYQSIPVIDGFFSLTYVRNTGAAFSMFSDLPASFREPFFLGVAVIAVGAIGYFVRVTPPQDKRTLIACAFVLGGALGNTIDRLAYGSVIDFLDVYIGDWHWPAFNVADSFISIGVVLLLFTGVLTQDDPADQD
ncbi:MAG: signal peptidase II [Deltaproteobacteria bacterium]